MSKQARRDYFRVMGKKYIKASKKRKGAILDDACVLTGLHRKVAARQLLSGARKQTPRPETRGRPAYYSHETKQAALKLWHAAGDIAAERLHPFIPDLLDKLVACGELTVSLETDAQLRKISLATVKRIVGSEKHRSTIRIGGTTKPGSILKRQITVRYGRWDESAPGWCETDTVAHCGETLAGTFIYSLSVVDICSGWSEQIAIMGKGERATVAGFDELRERLPFPLLGVDSDNGSEFINWHMQRYAKAHKLTFTRSRPYKKNDNAHIEQKNWTAVRQLFGYRRMDTEEQLLLMNDLYRNEWRLYLNFFQPTMKVRETTKDQATGKKTKRYYQAKTPYQRLMEHPDVSLNQKALLQSTYDSLNPLGLQRGIQQKLNKLAKTFREPFIMS